MKHTSGPWTAMLNERIWKIGSPDGNVCIIAHEDRKNCDKSANARLIAAAPELLAVLQEYTTNQNGEPSAELWERMRAAVAKATGGSK